MAGDHLLRSLAPLPPGAWARIDEEARTRLEPALAARRVVDFAGPLGWTCSATALGRTGTVTGSDGLEVRRRRVLPLVEVRVPFAMFRQEFFDADRGAADPDLRDLARAAHRMAVAENAAVFHGWAEAGVDGVVPASPHPPVPRAPDFEDCPRGLARAVTTLLEHGVGGPCALVLGGRLRRGHRDRGARRLPAPRPRAQDPGGRPGRLGAGGCAGGVVLSLRGGDFVFESGQDLSVGFTGTTATTSTSTSSRASASGSPRPRLRSGWAPAERTTAERTTSERTAAETTAAERAA